MNFSNYSRSELWNIIKEHDLLETWGRNWKNSKTLDMICFLVQNLTIDKGLISSSKNDEVSPSEETCESKISFHKNHVVSQPIIDFNEVEKSQDSKHYCNNLLSLSRLEINSDLPSHIVSYSKFHTWWYVQKGRKPKDEEGPQFYSHRNGEKYNNEMYMAREIKINQKSTNIYGSYVDLNYFLTKVYHTIPPDKRCFYEQIKKNTIIYEYYDLDLKYGSNGMNYDNNKLFDMFTTEREMFGEFILSKLNPKKLRILHASVEGVKTSLHITHRSLSFINTDVHKKFVELFLTYLKDKNSPLFYIIDKGVYTKNRNFRIIGSTKIGQNRPLVRYENHRESLEAPDSDFFVRVYSDKIEYTIDDEILKNISDLISPPPEPAKIDDDCALLSSNDVATRLDSPKLSKLPNYDGSIIELLLEHLNPERCNDYCEWMKICFILKHYFEPENTGIKSLDNKSDDRGLNLFHAWSSGSEKYDEEGCNKLWNDANNSNSMPLTIRSLFYMVKDDDPEWYAKYQSDRKSKDINKVSPDTKLTGSFSSEVRNSRYLDTMPEVENLLIKSYLGTGKTFQIKKILDSLDPDATVLVLSPRRLYAIEISEKLKIGCYLNMSNDDLNSSSKFVISMESLWKLEDVRNQWDLVVADEIESCLTQFHSFETMESNIHDNLRMFEKIIRNAGRVIWSDAFLSQRTIQVALKLDLKFTYIWNKYEPEKRTAARILMKPDDDPKSKKMHLNPLYDKIIELIKDGMRVFFVSAGKEKMIEGIMYILKEIPTLDYKYYCNGHSENSDLEDVNKNWSKCQMIATTTTITVGIDYCSIENKFDVLCAYFVGSGPLVRDLFQTLMRPRHVRGDKNQVQLYYSLNNFGIAGSLQTRKEIEYALNYRQNNFEENLKFLLPSSKHDIDLWKRTPWVEENFIGNELEKNLNRSNYELFCKKFLLYCGYNLIEIDSTEFSIEQEIENVPKKLYEEIENIESQMEFNELMNLVERGQAGDDERAKINKYLFNIKIGSHQDVKNIGNIYNRIYTCNDLKLKIQFNNLRWYKDRNILLCDNYLDEVKDKELVTNSKLTQLTSVVSILNDLKISDLFGGKIIIKKELIDSLDGLKLRESSKNIFGYRDRSNDGCEETSDKIRYLKGILCSWFGGNLIKRRIRKMKDGKSYDLDGEWDYVPDSDIINIWPVPGLKSRDIYDHDIEEFYKSNIQFEE